MSKVIFQGTGKLVHSSTPNIVPVCQSLLCTHRLLAVTPVKACCSMHVIALPFSRMSSDTCTSVKARLGMVVKCIKFITRLLNRRRQCISTLKKYSGTVGKSRIKEK